MRVLYEVTPGHTQFSRLCESEMRCIDNDDYDDDNDDDENTST